MMERTVGRLSALLLLATIAMTIGYQAQMLHYLEWGDESETIVTTKMLAAGMSLYSEVFNHHGPLTFLPGLALESFGKFGVAEHRIPIALLQLSVLLAIYGSPLLKRSDSRTAFVVIAAVAVVTLLPGPPLYGHTYIYQVLAGQLIAIILAQYALPAILGEQFVRASHVALGNMLIAALPFLAVTYLPAAVMLFAASLRRRWLRTSVLALTCCVLLNLMFLGWIGSFKGFIADHIYLNSQVMPQYNGGQGMLKLAVNVLSTLTGTVGYSIAFVGLILGISLMAHNEGRRLPWRSALIAMTVMSLLIRGHDYHGATFWYAYITLIIVILCMRRFTTPWKTLCLLISGVLAIRLAYPLTLGNEIFVNNRRTDTTEFSGLARKITGKNDRIIAYSFRNFEYIAAERLPASGYFFYLPWQEKYLESPILGIAIDACSQINSHKPKIMLIDKLRVWGKFPWESYARCVQEVLDRDYGQIPGRPYYVRNDLYREAMEHLGIAAGSYSAESVDSP